MGSDAICIVNDIEIQKSEVYRLLSSWATFSSVRSLIASKDLFAVDEVHLLSKNPMVNFSDVVTVNRRKIIMFLTKTLLLSARNIFHAIFIQKR